MVPEVQTAEEPTLDVVHPEVVTQDPTPPPTPSAPEPRRSDRVRQPRILLLDGQVISNDDRQDSWTLSTTGSLADADPRTYEEAMSSPLAPHWKKALDKELESFAENKVMKPAILPPGRKVVGCKPVFKTKRDQNNVIIKYKARIVAKGYSQMPGIDFDETSTPVVSLLVLRAFFTLVAINDLEMDQMDVVTAFLNGKLDRPIYMECPPGYVLPDGFNCVLLLRALYGLKQAGRTWWEGLDKHLVEVLGFVRTRQDWGLYWHKERGVYVVVYVDDLLMAGPRRKDINELKGVLKQKWKMTENESVDFMLGMKVIRDRQRKTIQLTQSAYIDMILERFQVTAGRTINTPLESTFKLVKDGESCKAGISRYQQLVGSLMWAAITTRPDLTFTVSCLSQVCANPTEVAWQAGIRVLRYLRGTRTHGIVLGGKVGGEWLEAWSDADWAGDVEDRKLTTGYVVKFLGLVISWGTVKQKTVALSTAEAEYMALTETIKDVIGVLHVINEFGIARPKKPITIHCDNQSAIALSNNPGHRRNSKHIDIRYHFI